MNIEEIRMEDSYKKYMEAQEYCNARGELMTIEEHKMIFNILMESLQPFIEAAKND